MTPSAMVGGRGLALCQEAPEVLTHWLRLRAALRADAGVAQGKDELPSHIKKKRKNYRVMLINPFVFRPRVQETIDPT